MIKISENLEDWSIAAAGVIIRAAKKAIEKNGRFTIALTGGTSPEKVYKLLATTEYAGQLDWGKIYVFWGDERWVSLDDERSNARMAFNTLLDHVPVPKEQIFTMWAQGYQPDGYAKKYEELLKAHLNADGQFDLVLLGMGEDGHTASLFPGTEVLEEKERWVVSYYLEAQEMFRITLTAPLINKAEQILFLVSGASKANALYEVLKGDRNPSLYPAQLIKSDDEQVVWLVDKLAASKFLS